MGRGAGGSSGGGAAGGAQTRGGATAAAPVAAPARRTQYGGGSSYRGLSTYRTARGGAMTRFPAAPGRPDPNVPFGDLWADENGRQGDVKWTPAGEVVVIYRDNDEVEILGYVGSLQDAQGVLDGHDAQPATDGVRDLNWVKRRVYAYVRDTAPRWPDEPVVIKPAPSAADGAPQPVGAGAAGGFGAVFGNTRGL